MTHKPGAEERIGNAINELDIDFSRFTIVGWFVSLLSFGVAGGIAYFVCSAMVRRNGLNLAAGMTFALILIGGTTVLFLALRWCFGLAGLSVTTPPSSPSESNNADSDTLRRMADAGMDMSKVHTIDFWHVFPSKSDAEAMAHRARQMSFHVASLEPNEESGGYDVQIQAELVPNRNGIRRTEQALAAIAAQCNGHADGWGVRQESD